jgi:transposase
MRRHPRRSLRKIVYGLLCTREGLPVAVEVFDGDTADPTTLAAQIKKLRQRFALERVVLVGDRGMSTSAGIREEVEPRPGLIGLFVLAQRRHSEAGER